MSSIEFSSGLDGEIIDRTQILVAGDLASLKALSRPESGKVMVEYLCIPKIFGAADNFVTNIATRDFGAAEYEEILHKMAPANLVIKDPINIKEKAD
jgi:hypothetical protein